MRERRDPLFGLPVTIFDGYTVGRLDWTTEPPKEPGYFWAMSPLRQIEPRTIVEIRETENGLRAYATGNNYGYPLDMFTHWLGPLPVPEPPTDL